MLSLPHFEYNSDFTPSMTLSLTMSLIKPGSILEAQPPERASRKPFFLPRAQALSWVSSSWSRGLVTFSSWLSNSIHIRHTKTVFLRTLVLIAWSSPSPYPNTDLILDVSTLYSFSLTLMKVPTLPHPQKFKDSIMTLSPSPPLTRDESRALKTLVVCIYKSSSV